MGMEGSKVENLMNVMLNRVEHLAVNRTIVVPLTASFFAATQHDRLADGGLLDTESLLARNRRARDV